MYKFKFADIGEGLHEGKVGEIYVKVGQEVEEGDSLFSVETDKVTSDIPSPVTGKVLEILIKQGETVHVGDDTFHFDAEGDETASEKVVEAPKEAAEKEESAASVVGEVKVSNEVINNDFQDESNSNHIKHDGVLATPLARRVAAEKGFDISTIKGTGINGRVLMENVLNHTVTATSSKCSAVRKTPGGETRVPVTSMRAAVAKAMKNSWANVAYTNLVSEVDMTSLWDQRKAIVATKQTVEKLGVKISFLPFIVKAVTIALESFPQFNAKHDAKTNELVQYHDKNIGIAVDTPHGLFVPVVKQAETKDLVEIAKEINGLAKKARDKKLAMQDMQGGTFSITNFGSVGALYGDPVINYPEIGILGTGAIIDRVMMNKSGQFVNGKVMHLTLAADHRWVDGADMGRLLYKIKTILENPIALLGEFQNV